MMYFSRLLRQLAVPALLLPAGAVYAGVSGTVEMPTSYKDRVSGTVDCNNVPASERLDAIKRNVERISKQTGRKIMITPQPNGTVNYVVDLSSLKTHQEKLMDAEKLHRKMQEELCRQRI